MLEGNVAFTRFPSLKALLAMHPILLQIGPFTLYSFGLMIALGLIAATASLRYRALRRFGTWAFEQQSLLLVVVFGFLGARLLWLAYSPPTSWAEALQHLLHGGLVWYAGLFSGMGVLWYLCHKAKRQPLVQLDIMSLPLALGLAFGRLGCLLAGCCYGAPTHLPWGITYPHGHPTHGLVVHPVPVYESLGALLLALLITLLERSPFQTIGAKEGRSAAVFLMGYALLRFGLEMLRGDRLELATSGLSASQGFSVVAMLGGLALWWWKGKAPCTSTP
jgi:phosphatidylglycerol:prolipoprotein diacylglycerol transferase